MAQGGKPPRHTRQLSRFGAGGGGGGSGGKLEERGMKKRDAVDEETIAFIKRTLCAKQAQSGAPTGTRHGQTERPLEELLPPLTSDNAVDVQLYAIISVILSQFVQSWYHRITPDADFVTEIVLIIAHCTRGIEQRLRHVDLESLLFDELPAVVEAHLAGTIAWTQFR
jgi:hypothetical protein